MQPSPYQQAIFTAYDNTPHNLLIQACAGSGKTTSLQMLCNRLKQKISVVAICFARINAEQFKTKLPAWVESSTVHSLGLRILRDNRSSVEVDKDKVDRHIGAIWRPMRSMPAPLRTYFRNLSRLVSLSGATMADLHDPIHGIQYVKELVYDLIPDLVPAEAEGDEGEGPRPASSRWGRDRDQKHTEPWDVLHEQAKVLQQALREDTSKVSFDDMIDHVVHYQLTGRTNYSLILGDEVQDWNRQQAAFVRLLAGKPETVADGFDASFGDLFDGVGLPDMAPEPARPTASRVILVGDRRQAIYGFRGADHNSMDALQEAFQCTELPLSVCYRCPTAVVREAQMIAGEETIESWAGALPGVVHDWGPQRGEALDALPDVSMVLCRMNAPLVPAALYLVRQAKKVCIRGKNFAQSMVSKIDTIAKKNKVEQAQALVAPLMGWFSKEIQKRVEAGAERSIESLRDQRECLLYFIEGLEAEAGIRELKEIIQSLFRDDDTKCVVLSSIHRAKGLEADHVLFLGPEKVPHPMAKGLAAIQQEMNMKYVAVTRAMRELHDVALPSKDEPFLCS